MTDLHTFLFADLAGFTALTEAHGDERAADLAHEFSRAAGTLLPWYGAEQIKMIGDALMLRIDKPADAVTLGLALTRDLLAECGYPTIRVGMHYGPAVHRGRDWFGATVNLAARVSGLAHGGEVLLTEATRESAGQLERVRFEAHGVHQLRNVTEPVKVFSAIPEDRPQRDVVVDPVCRMAVDPEAAAGTLLHRGRRYFLCSLECAARFAGAPELYANSEAR